jgi:ABC-type multidrug transport system ATPase subunit
LIRTFGLSKKFHHSKEDLTAVDSVDIQVNRGEIFGLLGPNGAGKTTFLRLLSCLLKPTTGSAEVSGYDIAKEPMEIRKRVGLLCEEPSLYDRQTVNENLKLYGMLYNIPKAKVAERIEELAKLLGFHDLTSRKAGLLSKGQRQRVSLARALLHDPEVLLLDEPTANLDPESANSVRSVIKTLQNEKKEETIVVCSHNLDEIAKVCNRVGLMNKGKIVGSGSIDDLERRLWTSRKFEIIFKGQPDEKILKKIGQVSGVEEADIIKAKPRDNNATTDIDAYHKLTVTVDDSRTDSEGEDAISEIIKDLVTNSNLRILSVIPAKHSLEEIYLKLLHDRRNNVPPN